MAAILKVWGFEAVRNERNSGGGEDVTHSIPGVWIEVKRQERLSLPEAVNQARRAAFKANVPVWWVVHRSNRQPWMVTLKFDDLLRFYIGTLAGCVDSPPASVHPD